VRLKLYKGNVHRRRPLRAKSLYSERLSPSRTTRRLRPEGRGRLHPLNALRLFAEATLLADLQEDKSRFRVLTRMAAL
jgi:hypothetical protein